MQPSPPVDEAQEQAVRVVVTPSQASYFAGERLSITITITNTRAPLPAIQSHSSHPQSSHRRGAHSVSYAPMARPPTSPGTRTTLPVPQMKPTPACSLNTRRGIIGKPRPFRGVDEPGERADSPRWRALLNRSQSISNIWDNTKREYEGGVRILQAVESPPIGTSSTLPTSPRVSSSVSRSAAVPIHHPHARKPSILDGQVHTGQLGPSVPSLTPMASAYSLTLDPIVESTASSAPPQTPDLNTPYTSVMFPLSNLAIQDSTSQLVRDYEQRRLGHGPPPVSVQPLKPRVASSDKLATPDELILYSYAQLSGTALRRNLLTSKAIGGGNLDIASYNPSALASGSHTIPVSTRHLAHGRSSSFSGGLLSALSASSAPSTSSLPTISQQSTKITKHSRSPSVFASLFQHGANSASYVSGLGLSTNLADIDVDTPLPTFEVQPSMLAVDLNLSPGESRSYIYELNLPHNLPPSYRGRTLKFSYEFVLGICRRPNSTFASSESHSRVIKVPIRVYNHVTVGSPPAPYDLLWPTNPSNNARLPRRSNIAKVVESHDPLYRYQLFHPPGSINNTSESVRLYAQSLLPRADGVRIHDRTSAYCLPGVKEPRELSSGDTELSCREAVEVLTRNPKKLSFDVNKDGVNVATLTFTKSAYRLGETILGVVDLNARTGLAKVLKLSALLEAHESLPHSLSQSSSSTSRQTRRIHAEQHLSYLTSAFRTTFSLDIPPDASPAFQVMMPSETSTESSYGGLEWKIRLSFLVAVVPSHARAGTEGVRMKTLTVDGPRGEWGATWTATRTISPLARMSALVPSGDSFPYTARVTQSWTSYLAGAFLGLTEPSAQYHDGDEAIDDEGHEREQEEDWKEMVVEMVECEVPIKVWPGNTAFKATEMVFEV